MKNFILVGNSNVGKTTLFNSLTGQDNHVGNWAGVTVVEKTAVCNEYSVTDLPGIYSLDCISMEERVAKEYLLSHKESIVLNIIECKNLARNIFLTLQLIELGFKPVLLVNMVEEAEKAGFCFDEKKLSQILGIAVYKIDARNNEKCKKLFFEIQEKKPKPLLYDKSDEKVAELRYGFIDSFCDKVLSFSKRQTRIKNFLFNKTCSLVFFVLLVGFVFWFTFAQKGLGAFLSNLIENILSDAKVVVALALENKCPQWFSSFFVDVVIEGVGAVAKFLPQILLLFLFLNMLEDTGYISYVAFAFDGLLSKVGLGGKSVFTLLLSCGCNTTAVATSKNLENKDVQKRTLLASTFFPCSAKMPVFVTVLAMASPLMKGYEIFIILFLYLISFMIAFFVSSTLSLFDNKKQTNSFVLEIPSLRFPDIKRVVSMVYKNSKEFVSRLLGTLLFCMTVIWFFKSFDFGINFLSNENIENSILAGIGKFVSVLFAPIGLFDWRICVSLLLGITAKEVVAGTLIVLFGSSFGGILSWQSVIVLLVFVSLYMPCISTVLMIKKECGTKTAVVSVLLNSSVAYLVCFVFFSFSLAFQKSLLFGFAICVCILIVALLILFVLKYKYKNGKQQRYKFEKIDLHKK